MCLLSFEVISVISIVKKVSFFIQICFPAMTLYTSKSEMLSIVVCESNYNFDRRELAVFKSDLIHARNKAENGKPLIHKSKGNIFSFNFA
jgi:hypothetical protein